MVDSLFFPSAREVVLKAGFQGFRYLASGVSRLEASLTYFYDESLDDHYHVHACCCAITV
jgi:hypothetical protein